MDLANLTADKKLDIYFSVFSGAGNWIDFEKIFDLYIESKNIVCNKSYLREVAKQYLYEKLVEDRKYNWAESKYGISFKKLDEVLSKFFECKYRKIENYYIVDDKYIIDEQNKIVKVNNYSVENIKDEDVTSRFNEYLESLGKVVDESLIKYYGDIINVVTFVDDERKSISCFYKIMSDGSFKELEISEERRIGDDMLKIDEALTDVTRGVSLSEIHEVVGVIGDTNHVTQEGDKGNKDDDRED